MLASVAWGGVGDRCTTTVKPLGCWWRCWEALLSGQLKVCGSAYPCIIDIESIWNLMLCKFINYSQQYQGGVNITWKDHIKNSAVKDCMNCYNAENGNKLNTWQEWQTTGPSTRMTDDWALNEMDTGVKEKLVGQGWDGKITSRNMLPQNGWRKWRIEEYGAKWRRPTSSSGVTIEEAFIQWWSNNDWEWWWVANWNEMLV